MQPVDAVDIHATEHGWSSWISRLEHDLTAAILPILRHHTAVVSRTNADPPAFARPDGYALPRLAHRPEWLRAAANCGVTPRGGDVQRCRCCLRDARRECDARRERHDQRDATSHRKFQHPLIVSLPCNGWAKGPQCAGKLSRGLRRTRPVRPAWRTCAVRHGRTSARGARRPHGAWRVRPHRPRGRDATRRH